MDPKLKEVMDKEESACVLSRVQLCNPVDCSPPGCSVMKVSRQDYWGESPGCTAKDLPGSGTKPVSFALVGGFFTIEPPGKPKEERKCE